MKVISLMVKQICEFFYSYFCILHCKYKYTCMKILLYICIIIIVSGREREREDNDVFVMMASKIGATLLEAFRQ